MDKNLKEIVEELILSSDKVKNVASLERELGLSKGTISKWNNSNNVQSSNLLKIADFFDVSIDYLMNRKKDNFKNPEEWYRIDTRNLTDTEIEEIKSKIDEYSKFLHLQIENDKDTKKTNKKT
ncbi:helix-turn-helix domain-containing protein [Companilactobacillus metriopterae]|uniref:helix-turn-helix domain-containing protein n=1 Tax=Companilactobacillus metriopterae TaxID=1909267 RepID=UPI00100A829E|nr:helix-turn-helix transcriptional regulator [Companilactobacillus metriopterae]